MVEPQLGPGSAVSEPKLLLTALWELDGECSQRGSQNYRQCVAERERAYTSDLDSNLNATW